MYDLGMTAFVWEQAKKENPKPQLLLPVPLVGVKGTFDIDWLIFLFLTSISDMIPSLALRDRMKSQFIEHEDQKQQLETIRQQLRNVKDQCEAFRVTMKRYQTSLLEYSHRILKVTLTKEDLHRSDFFLLGYNSV
jgi:hypothetical protein